jgi:phosphatidylserine/phosphatidylglycerophosphate/cardiolipin synthase-like enzyme
MMKKAKLCLLAASALFCLAGAPAWQEGSGWWTIYLTSPGRIGSIPGAANPETGLVGFIGKAEKYIHGAFYEVSAPAVVEALCAARGRGVEVQLVTEADTLKKRGKAMRRFQEAGIEVVTDSRRGLMHNKFAVIDGIILWNGSYNATLNDGWKNNNNALAIRSTELAAIYEDEFVEMFRDRVFGNRKEPGPFADLRKRYYVSIQGTDINAYFSPEDNIERIIIKRIEKAKISIHFLAFSFTSDGIGEAMIAKHKKGVTVTGIFERRGSREAHSEYAKMKLEGLPVRLDHNRSNMHHKVIVIDSEWVITGSYNYSRNANRSNDENIMIIDNREIAGRYLAEFRRLW